MLDATIKSIIDTARNVLVGKVPNPVSQIDLITIAMIYKFMDDMDSSVIQRGGKASFFKSNYDEKLSKEKNDELGNINLEPYAWHKLLSPSLGNEGRISLYSEALEELQRAKQIPDLFRRIFKGAFLPFRDGATLTMFLKEINKLTYDNSENLGNGFEYLLSIMGSQGDAGQFRTPRHIIDFIVDIVNPSKDDTILDPACGTAGFLISTYKHILKHNSEEFDAEKEVKSYSSEEIEIEHNLNGDKLTPTDRLKLTQNIKGYDISPDMQKLALVNLYLHGFKSPDIAEYDTLTNETKWNDTFDIILANPPFMTPKGGIQPHKKFSIQANRSEVLFVDYIAEHLNLKGKAGIIVPEGIIFQSANAYHKLRKKLIEENYLYAVVSLPSGIFQPYSGVKTSILLIDREIAKKSDSILFVDIKNDGYDLGAQRKKIDKNDLPEAFYAIKDFKEHCNEANEKVKEKLEKYETVNLVKKSKIAKNGDNNLSGLRYIKAVDYSDCKWKQLTIGDVCLVKGGKRLPKGKEFAQRKTEHPYLRVADFNNGGINQDNLKYIDNEVFNDISNYIISKNDVFISIAGTIGLTGIIPENLDGANLTENAAKLVINDRSKIYNKYIHRVLQSDNCQNQIKALTHSVGVPKLALERIRTIQIPLPPIEMQEEIVKELDAYQAVIDGATKVVENWKPTLPVNPIWEKVKLGDVCNLTYGYTDTAKNEGDARYVRITDINEFGRLKDTDIKYIQTNEETNNFVLKKNDLVVARTGATYGKTALFKEDYQAVYASFLIKLDFDNTKVYNPYYWAFAQSHSYWEQAKSLVTGGGQPQFNANAIKNIEFAIPPTIEEQKEIVAKIEIEEQVVEQCKKLIEIHEQKISDKIKSIWCDTCD